MKSELAMVMAIGNMARATILAEEAILKLTPDARLCRSDATSYYPATNRSAIENAGRHNEIRFIPLDLCYGHDVSASMYEYLFDHRVTL